MLSKKAVTLIRQMSNDFFVSLNFIVIKAKYTGYRLAWSTTCEFGAYDDDENLVSINPIF